MSSTILEVPETASFQAVEAAQRLRTTMAASHVEPDASGRWFAQIIDGPVLGPFEQRSEAIAAELAWLTVALRQSTTHTGVQ